MASSYANFKTALYTKTNVSGLVDVNNSAKLYGIYEGKATVAIPVGRAYGIFNFQGAEEVVYGFNATQLAEPFYIQLRVYSENALAADNLVDTWVSTLGTSLTVTGFTIGWLQRQNDLPPTDQQLDNRYIFGRGRLIKVIAE